MPGPGAAAGGVAAAAAYKDKHEQILRIAASDVAAVAGYHEWVDVRDLFLERLLYQDLDHLLRLDAANVGIEVEDRHQRSERLLAKVGNGELKAVRRKAGDGGAVETVKDAQALRDKARSILKEAEAKKKLTKAEAKELESDLRHDINTQFGTRNENFALSVYERRSGAEVICSNERIMVWPFPGSKISGEKVPEGAMDPPPELGKGWTKKDSRGGAELAPSGAEGAAFASAVARCLAQLPALATLEQAGSGGVMQASPTSGADSGDGWSDRAGNHKEAAKNGTARAQLREGGGQEGEMMDVGTPVSEAVGEGARTRLAGGDAAANPAEKRELVPGVAWPEWRGSSPSAAVARLGVGEEASPEVVAPSAAAAAAVVETVAGRAGGDRGGLWFPPSLTSRQRAAVATAAGELGFCHGTVAGETGGVHVVVWEPAAAARTTSPSQKASVGLPPDAPAAAVAGPASGRSKPRRGSSLLVPQAAAAATTTNPEPDRDPVAHGHGSTVASEGSTQALGGQLGGRRDSVAMMKSTSAGSSAALPALAVAPASPPPAEAHDGNKASSSSSSSSPSVNGGTTTTVASDESVSSSTEARGPNGNGSVAAPAKPRVMSLDRYSGGAVYAWGEGPPAAAAAAAGAGVPSGASGVMEELPDGQEWSVWSRNPQTAPQAEEQAGEGRAGPATNGEMEVEEETSPAAGGDKVAGRRAETLSERRKNACFVVVGAVDGVAEEVTDAPEDAETWETRRVVVEVKNRMNKARHPPPLYDQIQLVTYMLMIGAPVGDLVQFVKTGTACRGHGKRDLPAKEEARATAAAADDVLVSRVELDCRTYHHKKHWEETILPRLYAFARMVYRFRGDDLLRWRYLLAAPSEQREMLVECCPYLDDVIHKKHAAAEPPSTEEGPGARIAPEVIVLDDDPPGGGAETPASAAAPQPQGGDDGGTGSEVAAPNGAPCGGGDVRTCEDQDAEGIGKSSGGSTVTILCQKSRRGEPFLEPLGDVKTVAPAADGGETSSPARKKAKVGGSVEQHGLAV